MGFDAESQQAIANLVRAVAARSAARATPYLDKSHNEAVTLHPWSENIALGPIRWGGAYAGMLPDRQLAAAVDGEVWKNLREDTIIGRDALAAAGKLFAVAKSTTEPLLLLLITVAFAKRMPAMPKEWRGQAEISILHHEALTGLVRQLGGGNPYATLAAELATVVVSPPIELPPAVLAAVGSDMRTWRTRATPPTQAIEPWAAALQNIDEEILEAAHDAYLQDEAVGAALTALLNRESGLELENARLWIGEAGSVQTLPSLAMLEKIAPDDFARIQHDIKEHAGRFKGKQRRQLGAHYLARLALLHAFDEWLRAFADDNEKVVEISGGEAARLAEEAARGGLYAFTLEAGVEAAAAGEQETFATGHLFADLKGFTALTATLKEIEVRQFLRQNFYEPLLKIAKDYFKGAVDLADRGGIRLNNLMGDAISMSGDPADLLRFSERATKLVQDGIGELISGHAVKEDAETEQQRRSGLETKIRDLKVKKAKGEGEPAALQRELDALQAELRGGKAKSVNPIELDFGFFVSYGPAPIDLTMQDDVFGKVYVALAEKINESARGVARDGDVFAALAKFAAAQPRRRWAFRIHVGPSIAGGLPEAMLDAWPTDPEEADMVAKALGGSIAFKGSTTMYNVGIGLSPETAAMIVADLKGDVALWQGKSTELDAALGGKYLLVEPRQTFLAFAWGDERRILRRCGKVVMKGFAEPPTIWEWVGPWLEVFTPLDKFVTAKGAKLSGPQALAKAG